MEMKTYFELKPEVAGGLGPASAGDLKARPPRLTRFNYELDVWPCDPLIEALSSFIVTRALKKRIVEAGASGVDFCKVQITKSGIFKDLYPDRVLPSFEWMQITGRAGRDDFGISSSGNLVVSRRICELISSFGLRHCEVTEYGPNGAS